MPSQHVQVLLADFIGPLDQRIQVVIDLQVAA